MLGDISLFAKTAGVLYIFYLDYMKKISLPLLPILLITIGSLFVSIFGVLGMKKVTPALNYHYHNFAIAIAGMLLLIRRLPNSTFFTPMKIYTL
jgi:hypothetical protein